MFDASALPVFLREAKVFPCAPRSKKPATKHGFEDASDDPFKIEEWKRINPAFNWAVATGASGLIVFDIDPAGMGWYEEIISREDAVGAAFRRAYKAKSPRGGLHIYFSGKGPSTASRIADGVDTRGEGGYVLLPGSYVVDPEKGIDGGYESLGGAFGAAPPEVLAIIPEKVEGAVKGDLVHVAQDRERNIQWCEQLLDGYVQSGRVAVEGAGGNNLTYQVAASLLDKGVTVETALDLMMDRWNDHCSPPWSRDEIHQILINAARYGEETRTGAKGFADPQDTFRAYAGMETEPEQPEEKRRRYQPIRLWDARQRSKEPRWLLPGFIPAIGTGLLYGRRGSMKTFVALDMALSVASSVIGQWSCAPEPQTVVYLAGEGANSLIRTRTRIWEERYFICDEPDFLVVPAGVPRYSDTSAWQDLKEGLDEAGIKPSLIVVDTVARLIAGLDENSAKDAMAAMDLLESLAQYWGCFVLGIHHAGKDEGRGARGSSVFEDAVDTVIKVRKVGNTGTELFVTKQRDSDYDPDHGFYFGAEEVESNGEKSVVLVRKEKPVEAKPNASKDVKISWLEREYVLELLAKLRGEATTHILAEEIANEFGADPKEIKRRLRKEPGYEDIRFGDTWRLGGFDL